MSNESERTIDTLEEDGRMCVMVVLHHIHVLLLYISNQIALGLETFYIYIGLLVGSWPLSTILVTFLFGAGLCTGLIPYFRQDTSYDTWIPSTADALDHREWVRRYFPEEYRRELAIISITNESGSFAQTEYLARLAVAQNEVMNLTVYRNHRSYTFQDICYRITQYSPCWIDSPLNRIFYNTNPMRIRDELILEESNLKLFNIFHTHNPVDFDQAFGLVQEHNGTVESIRALTLQFRIRSDQNFSEVAEDWEDLFISWSKTPRTDTLDISVFTSDTVEEETQQAFGNDVLLLSGGYALTFIYFALFLGKFNRREFKLWLAVLGILCIGFIMVATTGLASYLQFAIGPVHYVIPFLLLGIGVDDMFVIVSSWQSSKPPKVESNSKYSFIARYTAKCLGAVGVSITVTSITNGVAFFVGAGTVLPSLSSFCIYAGIAILLLFLFQVTFFAAFVVIDYKRQQANLDALFICLPVPPVTLSIDKQKEWDLMEAVRDLFSGHIGVALAGYSVVSRAVQLVVIFLATVIAGFSIYGCLNLQVEIDIEQLFRPDSYAVKFIDQREAFFPNSGIPVSVYTGEIDYFSQQPELHLLNHILHTDPTLRSETGGVEFWFEKFISWMQNDPEISAHLEQVTYNTTTLTFPTNRETQLAIRQARLGALPIIVNSAKFYAFLCEFLKHPISAEVTDDIVTTKWNSSNCGECCVVATRGHATFIPLRGTTRELWAMEGIRDRVSSVPFSPERAFAYTEIFLSWETTYVIVDELIRNLIIATVIIFLITLLLVANVRTAIFVLLTVGLTMVDVAGLLYYWKLSINTVTAVLLVLVVGLSVDYSAHVAHAFMRATGSRKERICTTLSEVGPPVLNGGLSTLLAFILLVFSESYVFEAFLKVFTGVVSFGLFHGLLLLPVLLGLLGPASHHTHFKRSEISKKLGINDDFFDQTINNNLDHVTNFDVELYEHRAEMHSIAERISTVPLASPPALFLNFQNSVDSNNHILDITPSSQLNNNQLDTQSASTIVQESSL